MPEKAVTNTLGTSLCLGRVVRVRTALKLSEGRLDNLDVLTITLAHCVYVVAVTQATASSSDSHKP